MGDHTYLTGAQAQAKRLCRSHRPEIRILFPDIMAKSTYYDPCQGKAKSYVSDNHAGYNPILHNINYRLN